MYTYAYAYAYTHTHKYGKRKIGRKNLRCCPEQLIFSSSPIHPYFPFDVISTFVSLHLSVSLFLPHTFHYTVQQMQKTVSEVPKNLGDKYSQAILWTYVIIYYVIINYILSDTKVCISEVT